MAEPDTPTPIIAEEDMVKLLGRPLTAVESTNYQLYLDIATERLESVICTTVEEVDEDREYDTREDYRTAFIDIFTDVTEVKLNDTVVDESKYSKRQWDARTATWFNSLVFNEVFDCDDVITVTASWGFASDSMPADLQALIARLFNLVSVMNKSDRSVASKQIEDFRITFNNDTTAYDQFIEDNMATIKKYSICGIGEVQHGSVRSFYPN